MPPRKLALISEIKSTATSKDSRKSFLAFSGLLGKDRNPNTHTYFHYLSKIHWNSKGIFFLKAQPTKTWRTWNRNKFWENIKQKEINIWLSRYKQTESLAGSNKPWKLAVSGIFGNVGKGRIFKKKIIWTSRRSHMPSLLWIARKPAKLCSSKRLEVFSLKNVRQRYLPSGLMSLKISQGSATKNSLLKIEDIATPPGSQNAVSQLSPARKETLDSSLQNLTSTRGYKHERSPIPKD